MTEKQQEAPERIWLPADTDSDTWNILAKNPSRNWKTGEPANNIEYVRADLLQQPVTGERCGECRICGHEKKWLANDGACRFPVPICSDGYHGTRPCGCKCMFPTATPLSTPAPGEAARRIREELAALCHDQWSGWMRYLFYRCETEKLSWGTLTKIPEAYAQRWRRQAEMSYSDLPEEEKESDRKEADRFIEAFSHHFPPTDPTQRKYFCSCGAACTAEEYIEHYFERGHDRGDGGADTEEVERDDGPQDTIWRNQKEYISVDNYASLVIAAKRELAEKVLIAARDAALYYDGASGERTGANSVRLRIQEAMAECGVDLDDITRRFTESGVAVEKEG